MSPRRRKWCFIAMTLLIVGAAVEGISYCLSHSLARRAVIYRARTSDDYENYLEYRDPVLGWPSPRDYMEREGIVGKERDSTGSRLIPAFPDPASQPARFALYGDSFTWSSEVAAEHAWASVLSTLLGERVSNYGFGGYGSDQAMLTFLSHEKDPATVVFLNHLSENIVRNVNRYRPLIAPEAGSLGLKPRFILDKEGALELVPIPSDPGARFLAMVADPRGRLDHDYFVPDGPSGVQYWSIPFTWRVVKGLSHYRVKGWFAGIPHYAEFYDPSHPSKALPITIGIFERFHAIAEARGKVPVTTVIPTGWSLIHFRDHGRWTYQPLLDMLARRDIDVLNFGAAIMERLGPGGFEALFDDIAGHFNEAGYRLLAEIAYGHLVDQGLADASSPMQHHVDR